jgi:hypothetical protein
MPRFHIFRISFILGVLLLNGKIRKHIKNPPGTYGGQFQGVQIFERDNYTTIYQINSRFTKRNWSHNPTTINPILIYGPFSQKVWELHQEKKNQVHRS